MYTYNAHDRVSRAVQCLLSAIISYRARITVFDAIYGKRNLPFARDERARKRITRRNLRGTNQMGWGVALPLFALSHPDNAVVMPFNSDRALLPRAIIHAARFRIRRESRDETFLWIRPKRYPRGPVLRATMCFLRDNERGTGDTEVAALCVGERKTKARALDARARAQHAISGFKLATVNYNVDEFLPFVCACTFEIFELRENELDT